MKEEITNYEEVIADHRRLTREMDIALHGIDGAAQQASLCDLIKPAERLRKENISLKEQLQGIESDKETDLGFIKILQAELRAANEKIKELESTSRADKSYIQDLQAEETEIRADLLAFVEWADYNAIRQGPHKWRIREDNWSGSYSTEAIYRKFLDSKEA